MNINVSHTRRQMIGSALGVLGVGVLATTRLPSVLALSSGLNEPAQALQQAERLGPEPTVPPDPTVSYDPTIDFPVELSTELIIGTPFGGSHYGVDIWRADAAPGHPLVACVDGVLIVQEILSGRQGNSWVIQGNDGVAYRYHHIDEFAADLELGDSVTRGQVIATMGQTGNAGAPHLHFEVRLGKHNGPAVDPVPLFAPPIPGVTIY
jgi:murein DD-endopeptidase MepM/ murein hydrolase activator NlpD